MFTGEHKKRDQHRSGDSRDFPSFPDHRVPLHMVVLQNTKSLAHLARALVVSALF
jgi:hypothetical protein